LFQRIAAIALNTLTEAVRQPVYGIILFSSVVLICITPTFSMYTMSEDVKIFIDMGLATMLLTGLLLAALTASGVIWREIENKTVLTVVTKPVNTFEFVVAKFIGILLALGAAMYVLTLVLVLMERFGSTDTNAFKVDWPVTAGLIGSVIAAMAAGGFANYFFNKNFSSTAVAASIPMTTMVFVILGFFSKEMKLQPFGADIHWDLLKAAGLVSLAVFIIGAAATAISTRLGTVMNIVLCFAVFFLGLLSDYLFASLAQVSWLAQIAYSALPNLQMFWLADALTMDRVIPMGYIIYCVLYAFLYQAGVVSLAVLGFGTRELS